MRNKQLIAALAILCISLIINQLWSQPTIPQTPLAYKTVIVGSQKVQVPYKKGEIVVDFSGMDSKDVKYWKGFFSNHGARPVVPPGPPRPYCPCHHELEVWTVKNPIDFIGVVEGAKGPQGGSGGNLLPVSLNYSFDTLDDISLDTPSLLPPSTGDAKGKRVVKVAVLDTGVDPDNQLLTPWLRREAGNGCGPHRDVPLGVDVVTFDPRGPIDQHGHGTHVNGIIAGVADEQIGMGLDELPARIEILNVKINAGDRNAGDLASAICGMYYAMENGARILNCSWGYRDAVPTKAMKSFLVSAKQQNILVVTGAGNNGMDISESKLKFWPAEFHKGEFGNNVISVGAYRNGDGEKIRLKRSNWGNTDIFALGGNVRSTFLIEANNHATLAECSGTSMATPFVSRAAAFILGEHPDFSMQEVKRCILGTATSGQQGGKFKPVRPKDEKWKAEKPGQSGDLKILNIEAALRCGQ